MPEIARKASLELSAAQKKTVHFSVTANDAANVRCALSYVSWLSPNAISVFSLPNILIYFRAECCGFYLRLPRIQFG